MVDPVQYNWMIYRLYIVVSTVLVWFLAWIGSDATPWTLWKGILLVVAYFVLLFLGFCLTVIGGTILNRKVDHPITEPEKMVVDQTYWLNGETHAIFKGVDDFTGKFLFEIYGVSNKKTPITELFRGDVRRYISDAQEVFKTKVA